MSVTNGIGSPSAPPPPPTSFDAFSVNPIFEVPTASGVGDASHATQQSQKFPRLSKPVELLRPSYDVLVIGSGYGGGVAASRLARGGQSVCVLERGREKWPGEYPSSLLESAPNLHIQGQFTPGNTKGTYVETGDPLGLYRLCLGVGQNVFTGNGLGGTSLLNANIFLRADKKTLALDEWPAEIKNNPDSLDKYYKRAASMLEPSPYPASYPKLAKLDLLQKQAAALGWEQKFYRPPQTTKFENGPNSTGVMMHASTGSGMDSTGVNDGSKSSTLVNYLSDAWNWGAEIFCECEVRFIKKAPKGDGYIVYFAWHGSNRRVFQPIFERELMWVHAKKCVFLAAGTLGTTEILLRSKQHGLPMSRTIGTRMSGNGDILAFGYNTDHEANSMARADPDSYAPVGPTITGIIDCREQENPLDGFVIEEGAVPRALVPALQTLLESMPGKIFPAQWGSVEKVRHFLSRQKSRVFGPYSSGGSMERTQVYLIMSHDSNQATLTLNESGKPVMRFLGVGRSQHVTYLNSVLAKATNAVGGTFINNPFFAALGEQQITVHPIGGADMSADGTADQGATTACGELLTGSGKEYHNGLVCVDGSIVPTALGVNPFATITALAERNVEHVAAKWGIKIDYDTKNGLLDLFGPPAKRLSLTPDLKEAIAIIEDAKQSDNSGTGFTEIMEGFIHVGGEIEDFTIAEEEAKGTSSSARFFLSVHAWDMDDLVHKADHPAMLTGTFTCGALSKDPFMVLRGKFQLFNDDPRTPSTQNLSYDFDMIGSDGKIIRFNGYKIVDPSVAFAPLRTWKATSTLYVTLTHLEDNTVAGRGILRITPSDFASELASFSATGSSLYMKANVTARFLAYFAKQTARFFFAPLNSLVWPTASVTGYFDKIPPTETIQIEATDGIKTTLRMWNPVQSSNTAQLSSGVPILFVPGAAVDHSIFALPTIKLNAIEFFTSSGATCFCVTHRVGKTDIAKAGWTIYDARLDIAAALNYITKRYPPGTKVYVVAHCAGSIALSMGLLDGTIPGANIKGISASNVFMNPKFARVNLIKAKSPISLSGLYRKLAGQWFSCVSSPEDSAVQQIMNQFLRFYPVGSRKELCNSVVCHRSELVFGRLWTHRNLNSKTHSMLSDFLGGVSMRCLEHLLRMGTSGIVTTWPSPSSTDSSASARELVDDVSLVRLKHIPIFFFSGSENAVFSPEATDISYTTLRNELDESQYERDVFEGFGHLDCWMGEKAAEVVWPRVKQHMIKVCSANGADVA